MQTSRLKLLFGMIITAVVSRFLPHPPNLTPVAAMALFGGATFADKRAAFIVPLIALFLSDFWFGFSALTPVVYGSFALIVCLGFGLRGRRSAGRIAAAALGGSMLFFLLTNLGVWVLTPLYPKTLSGLWECYIAALPFFRNTVTGDFSYCAILFGGLALAEKQWPKLTEATPSPA